jgi:hypothetical protein
MGRQVDGLAFKARQIGLRVQTFHKDKVMMILKWSMDI